jgi:hypothetical protein
MAQSQVSNTLAQSMLNKSISVGATHSGTKPSNIEETKSEGYNSEEEELKQMSKSTIWTQNIYTNSNQANSNQTESNQTSTPNSKSKTDENSK